MSGTWWKDNQLVVTANMSTRHSIVQMHHDPPAYGHPGISRTLDLTARKYWWPHMAQDVKDYVKGCADCQRNKTNNQARRAPLSPIFVKLNALPFETVAMDFIVKLPVSDGYDSVLTVSRTKVLVRDGPIQRHLLQGKQAQDASLWFPSGVGPDRPWEIHAVTL